MRINPIEFNKVVLRGATAMLKDLLEEIGRQPDLYIHGCVRNSYFDYDTNMRVMTSLALMYGGVSVIIPNRRLKSLDNAESCDRI